MAVDEKNIRLTRDLTSPIRISRKEVTLVERNLSLTFGERAVTVGSRDFSEPVRIMGHSYTSLTLQVTDWRSPASTGLLVNGWTYPTYAYAHDASRARANGATQDYYNFGFTPSHLPSGSIPAGYEVSVENRVVAPDAGLLFVQMMKAGVAVGSLVDNNPMEWTETADTYKTLGSPTDLAGASWLDTDWTGIATSGVLIEESNSVNNLVNHVRMRIWFYH